MAKFGYARVSTRDQNAATQLGALERAGCERIFIDTASGKLARRPELDKCLDYLRPGDQLVITKLDRLGRSARHLIDVVPGLGERDVDLEVLAQGIDITTPTGWLLFHLIGAMVGFAGGLISEDTRDRFQAARAGLRCPKLNDARSPWPARCTTPRSGWRSDRRSPRQRCRVGC